MTLLKIRARLGDWSFDHPLLSLGLKLALLAVCALGCLEGGRSLLFAPQSFESVSPLLAKLYQGEAIEVVVVNSSQVSAAENVWHGDDLIIPKGALLPIDPNASLVKGHPGAYKLVVDRTPGQKACLYLGDYRFAYDYCCDLST